MALPGSPSTLTLAGTMVADFDGNGIPDVAAAGTQPDGTPAWLYSRDARTGRLVRASASTPLLGHPIGRFDGQRHRGRDRVVRLGLRVLAGR